MSAVEMGGRWSLFSGIAQPECGSWISPILLNGKSFYVQIMKLRRNPNPVSTDTQMEEVQCVARVRLFTKRGSVICADLLI